MKNFILNEVLAKLRFALENDDLIGAIRLIESLRPADQADLMEELEASEQVALFSQLDPGQVCGCAGRDGRRGCR